MKIIHVLSGGLDSTVLLHSLIARGDEVEAVTFDYGQRHRVEIEFAKENCLKRQVPWRVIQMPYPSEISSSSLTNPNFEVPEGHYQSETMKQTVVPNRNMIMISLAAAIAMNKKFDAVSLGVHAGDHTIYPDCRPEFAAGMNQVLQIADGQPITLETPFIHISKKEIVLIGHNLNVPFELTQTCYKGKKLACGQCGSCRERLEAFAFNYLKDPLPYEA